MAEFLIYNKENWMDSPSKQRPDLTGYENVQRKINENSELDGLEKTIQLMDLTQDYNVRHQRDDIVERRQDGFGMCGKEPLAFACIKVIEIPFEDAEQYTKPLIDGYIKKYERKYSLDITKIILDEKKEAKLTLVQFNSLLTEKT